MKKGSLKTQNELIRVAREGLNYSYFDMLAAGLPFTISEWSDYLHITQRSLQRYKKNNQKFQKTQAEKILQIVNLFNKGEEVFGSRQKFTDWLDTENVAVGNVKPKTLLDTSIGIQLLYEELLKIEQGVFA